ncbi:MAG: pyridoxal-phosphate dependent enzyme, partial [Oscillospiraceae bacterium]
IAQAYYAKKQGLTKLSTETGAGQWGTALAEACAHYDLDLRVYMVRTSYDQKPFRRDIIRTFGATVIPSPSPSTKAGRKILEKDPNCSGSLGTAISEAVEIALETEGCRYVLGSVLNQVALHQSIIGLESKLAMERIIAVEPKSCPSLTRGKYAYDFCDTGKITPLAKMYTLGCEFLPSPNHAGGLRYHGMSPILSKLYHDGYMEAVSVEQTKVFEAATYFAKIETILPAPESAHAIRTAIDEALKCKETGEEKTILFGLTGTGYFDMKAYTAFMDKEMTDYIPSDEDLEYGFSRLPDINKI